MSNDTPQGRANARRMRGGVLMTLGAVLAVVVVALLLVDALFG